MDAPVSLQGQNNDYENKSLEMVLVAKNMKLHFTDLMEKVWVKVITQIKTLGDAIGMIWKKGYFGGRGNFEFVILQGLPWLWL